MLKGFEDAFVDVQASVISLCLELLSNSGIKIMILIILMLFLSRKGNYILQMIGFQQKK